MWEPAIQRSATSPANANVVVQYRMKYLYLLYAYTIAIVDQPVSRMGSVAQIACCVWIAAAQAWYYLQFRELFRGAVGPIVRRLWR